ncbi:DJ-1/PfpI family protein [Aestuariibaculum sediminum]|uniref:DJ-1/PfpI family protein n=1 Tax=Aestuariibaculum sediminum TaxID=2770637 RepID=A0A8J6UDV9_9FLAO|nr:DJ-1/PfpI family protein [Aestuariibaculum sediminum]MBD0833219.1 DJ-1/PfpI family protein [Aestuariibaculum sediminum]
MTKKINVGIFIFNEVEVLDFAGPFEVFSLVEDNNQKIFNVITIGEGNKLLSARNGLKVHSDYLFNNHPKLDILIIPGGYGAEHIEIKNKCLLNWIKEQSNKVQILASVCTGALLLAECGLLNNKKATTHWMDLDRLEQDYPKIEVVRDVKFVDEGNLLTSGGISAGINMSFHIIKRLLGKEIAEHTAKRMEYDIVIK